MKATLLFITITLFYFSNVSAQCPGPTALSYKTKLQNAGANMEASTAYSHLANYYNYKCKCDNGVTNPKELAKFIKDYARSYSALVSKYGTMSPINGCKGLGSGNNKSSGNNQVVKEKKLLGMNQGELEAVSTLGIEVLAQIQRDKLEKEALEKKTIEDHKLFNEHIKRIHRIKDFQNIDGTYKAKKAFNYKANFNDSFWNKRFVYQFAADKSKSFDKLIKIVDKSIIEIKVNNRFAGSSNGFNEVIFEHPNFNIGKDFIIEFEVGANIREYKYPFKLYYILNYTFGFKISNCYNIYTETDWGGASVFIYNHFSSFPVSSSFMDARMPNQPEFRREWLIEHRGLNNLDTLVYFPAKGIAPEKILNKYYNEYSFSDWKKIDNSYGMTQSEKYKYYRIKRKKERKKTSRKEEKKRLLSGLKNLKSIDDWVYSKIKIIKEGESIIVYYNYIDPVTFERINVQTPKFPFQFVDSNTLSFIFHENRPKFIKKYRIKNFTIKQ